MSSVRFPAAILDKKSHDCSEYPETMRIAHNMCCRDQQFEEALKYAQADVLHTWDMPGRSAEARLICCPRDPYAHYKKKKEDKAATRP